MAEENSFKNVLGSIFNFLLSLIYFAISISLALLILFILGWVVKVLFGNMTTSHYFHLWLNCLTHPGKTAAGEWLQKTLERIRK